LTLQGAGRLHAVTTKPKTVIVKDKMQRGYRYELVAPPPGGHAPDQTLEGDPAAHHTDQTALRAGRPDVATAPTPGAAALGL
jgi:hypothetical protein